MTDDKTRQLENRIDTLESKIEKMMPSRRDALKMGGAALVGGAAMSGTASAGTNQVGTIGSQASPVDLESEDINNADTVTTENLVVNNTATGPFGGGVPPGFSYVDQTSNRSIDTVFTNTTGKALLVKVGIFKSSGLTVEFEVNDKRVERYNITDSNFPFLTVSAIVPDGATYEVKGSDGSTVSQWFEAEL